MTQTAAPTIGWSSFATERHFEGNGLSYSTLSHASVVALVQENWDKRTPGAGEKGVDRKVLVPVPARAVEDYSGQGGPPLGAPLFRCGYAKIRDDMTVHARVKRRREHEDPYIETYVTDAEPEPAAYVNVVCYSADALLENDGERDTDCDWEIVCIIASPVEDEPMYPLAMARNMLEQVGGTFGEYSGDDFAEAVWYHAGYIKVIRQGRIDADNKKRSR